MTEKLNPQLIREYLKLRQKVGELELYRSEAAKTVDSLKKFKALFYDSPDLSIVCSKEGKVLFINEVVEKLSGATSDEVYEEGLPALFDEEDLGKASRAFSSALRGENILVELTFKHSGLVSEFKGFPMRDDSGNITGIMAVAREISSRKRTEEELIKYMHLLEEKLHRQSVGLRSLEERLKEETAFKDSLARALNDNELKYMQLADSVSDGVIVLDNDAAIRYASSRAALLLGYGPGELSGRSCRAILPGDKALLFEKMCRVMDPVLDFSQKKAPLLHKCGKVLEADIRCVACEVAGRRSVQLIVSPQPAPKAAGAELKTLLAAIEHSGSLISITDINGLLEYANTTFLKATGIEKGSFLGRHIKTISTAAKPEDNDDLWLTVLEGSPWRGVLRTSAKDGGVFFSPGLVAPIKSDDGDITHLVCVQENVPEGPSVTMPSR
ncbi:MAG: PAS domain S-box protein, partial [Deltaproteobacteria bacterium]|nr:PAS domain S-box protein [Deltaproteobacteria bacterium]